MYFTNLTGTILVQAKDKVKALHKLNLLIYWEGNTPYGLEYTQSKRKIYLHRAKVYKGKKSYTLDCGLYNPHTGEERLVKFDLDFNYVKELIF